MTVAQHHRHPYPQDTGQVSTVHSFWKIAEGRIQLRRAADFTCFLIDRGAGREEGVKMRKEDTTPAVS